MLPYISNVIGALRDVLCPSLHQQYPNNSDSIFFIQPFEGLFFNNKQFFMYLEALSHQMAQHRQYLALKHKIYWL